MDDSPSVVYHLEADNTINGWLKPGIRPALYVRCQERRTSVYVNFDTALNPELGLHNQHTVRVRWDDGDAVSQRWGESTDGEAAFAPNAVAFVRRLEKATRLRLEVVPFNASPQVVDFDVQGFGEDRLKTIRSTCRW
jgi:type VI secretion system protein VasI